MTIRDQLRGALTNVLSNASNFPERVQTRILGQDMGPLTEKATDAAVAVFEHAHNATGDEREALIALELASYGKRMSDGYMSVVMRTNEEAADIALAAGFRRTVQGEPEPSTAKAFCRCGSLMVRADRVDAFTLTCPKVRCGEFRFVYKRPQPQGEPTDATTDAAVRAAVGSPPSGHVSEAPDSEREALSVGAHEERRDAVQVEVDKGGDDSIHTRAMRGVPNRVETQGEPTNAQVTAEALRKWPHDPNDANVSSARAVRRLSFLQGALWMRAALRAASATQEGENR